MDQFDFGLFFNSLTSCGSQNLSDAGNNLLIYLAWLGDDDVTNKCYDLMLKRTPYDKAPQLGIKPQDTTVCKTRMDLLSANNKAYELAVKINPTKDDLNEFILTKVCHSTAFPVKLYLLDHPQMAKTYRGFQPIGKDVAKFYNKYFDDKLSSTLDFEDHVKFKNMVNRLSDLTGLSTVAIDHIMYCMGSKL